MNHRVKLRLPMSTKSINGIPMMAHLQMEELTGKYRPDNVKQTMDDLRNKGLISLTHIEERYIKLDGKADVHTVYYVTERDSHVVVARLSPEYTAFLVNFWLVQRDTQVVKPLTREQQLANAVLLFQEVIAEKDVAEARLGTLGMVTQG